MGHDRLYGEKHCLGCGYNLRGLAEFRCPECGRRFDPGDPESFALSGKRTRGIAFWIPTLAAAYPLLPTVLLLTMWVAATISLGYPPKEMVDDPMSINVVVNALRIMTMLAILPIPLYFIAPVGFILGAIFGWDTNRVVRPFHLFVLSLVCLGCFVLTFFRLGGWFVD